jgi:hypothetical protein
MATPEELPPDQYLVYLIGVTTQWHISIDIASRQIFAALVWPGPARVLVPTFAGRVLDDCQALMAASDLSEEVKAVGKAALSEAKGLNDKRNRYVHDFLIPTEDEGTWQAFSVAKPKQQDQPVEVTPKLVRELNISMQRNHVRLSAVLSLIMAESAPTGFALSLTSTRDEVLEIAWGQFFMNERGGHRPMSKGPIPEDSDA